MAQYSVPSNVVLALLELCTAQTTDLTGISDFYSIYNSLSLFFFPSFPLLSLFLPHYSPLSPSDYITNIPLYLAVLQLLRSASLLIREHVCQQVISLLHLNPSHINSITSVSGWDSLFLWLLTTETNKKENEEEEEEEKGIVVTPIDSPAPVPSNWMKMYNEDDPTFRTFAVVTETVGYILWSETKEKKLWQTWACMLTSLDMFTKDHELIVPSYMIKQR